MTHFVFLKYCSRGWIRTTGGHLNRMLPYHLANREYLCSLQESNLQKDIFEISVFTIYIQVSTCTPCWTWTNKIRSLNSACLPITSMEHVDRKIIEIFTTLLQVRFANLGTWQPILIVIHLFEHKPLHSCPHKRTTISLIFLVVNELSEIYFFHERDISWLFSFWCRVSVLI